MGFLMCLIDQLILEGSRVLVFSQSRKILDIVQRLLGSKSIKCVRMDGSISQVRIYAGMRIRVGSIWAFEWKIFQALFMFYLQIKSPIFLTTPAINSVQLQH